MPMSEARKRWREAHKEELAAKGRIANAKYRAKHREKEAIRRRTYYEKNKSREAAKGKLYRARNHDAVKAQKRNARKSHGAIRGKLADYKKADIYYGRENNITLEYVVDLLETQNNQCAHCECEVKLAWTRAYDPGQFSVNRIKNKYGHVFDNVEICCLHCNLRYGRKV